MHHDVFAYSDAFNVIDRQRDKIVYYSDMPLQY